MKAGRPRLDLDIKIIKELRDGRGLGWRLVALEYEKTTGFWVSRETVKRRYYSNGNQGHYAPNLCKAGKALEVYMRYINRTYISRQSYDDSFIVRLGEAGISWRSIAKIYTFRTGRRIDHKTAKRHYLKIKGGSHAKLPTMPVGHQKDAVPA